jgi:MFS family permease
MFGALTVRDFRYLWVGTFSSQIGLWVQQVALGWLAYDLTGSATFLGVVAMARSIPSVLLILPAGVFADRWDRRRLVLTSQVVTMINSTALAWLVASGQIQPLHLVIGTFVNGAAQSLNMPARQSLAPHLAGRQHIANAVALNSVSFNTSRVLGPSVAGILVWISGLSLCFSVQAVLMAVAVVCTIGISGAGRSSDASAHGSIWGSLVDGLAYVHRTRAVRAVFLVAAVPILIGSIYNQLMPVFARDVLDIGPSGMGALMSAVGFGSLVGSFLLAALSYYPRKGRIMIGMGLLSGVGLAMFALSQWLGLSLVALAVTGFALVVCLATGQTLLNLLAPNEFRGRVLSIWSMIWSFDAVTLLPAGWLTDHAGAPTTVLLSGALVFLFFVFMLSRKGEVRDYDDRAQLGGSEARMTGQPAPARA